MFNKTVTNIYIFFFQKVSKRLHLSKVKLAKFNESSQLVLFYILSVIWGIDIIIRSVISNINIVIFYIIKCNINL